MNQRPAHLITRTLRLLVTAALLLTALGTGITPATRAVATASRQAPAPERALDLKQAIHDLAAGADRPLSVEEIVSSLNEEGIGPHEPASRPALQTNPVYGAAVTFNPAATYSHIAAARLSDTQFVVAYRDGGSSSYGTAIVGNVSGTSISLGSEYVFNSGYTSYESVAALSSTKFVVAYRDGGSSSYGTAIVGNVSGTAITYGAEYVFNSAASYYTSVAALSSTQFVVAYTDGGSSYYGTAIVGDVSGTSITYGAEYVFNSASTSYASVAALSSTKFVVAYEDGGSSSYGTAIVGNVSDSTITYGSEYVFNSASTYYASVAALSSTQFVVAYRDGGSSNYGTAIVGDVSDSTITYGAEYVFNEATTTLYHSGGVSQLSSTLFVVGYENASDDDGRTRVGTVTGSAISWDNAGSYNSGSRSYDVTVAALSGSHYIVAWDDESDSDYGKAIVGVHTPTLVELASFSATPHHGYVRLQWETASETDTEGFNLWRSEDQAGPYSRLNAALIPARGGPATPASYSYLDGAVTGGVTYWYTLEDVDTHGASTMHGPVVATARHSRRLYLPILLRIAP